MKRYTVDSSGDVKFVDKNHRKTPSKRKEPQPIISYKKPRSPICNIALQGERLSKHKDRNHKELTQVKEPKKGKPIKIDQQTKQTTLIRGKISDSRYETNHDERDGEKHWGHFQRDFDGKYGSMPLFDDYSEESSPE